MDALFEYDEFAHITRRKYIPPNFAEIRHILNLSQLHAVAEKLKLITFDADGIESEPLTPHAVSSFCQRCMYISGSVTKRVPVSS